MEQENASAHQRLVVVSNRLPIVIEDNQGTLSTTAGSGGLITALAPVLRNRGGLWVGWTGYSGDDRDEEITSLIASAHEMTGFTCCPVFLNKEDVDLYYQGFSN